MNVFKQLYLGSKQNDSNESNRPAIAFFRLLQCGHKCQAANPKTYYYLTLRKSAETAHSPQLKKVYNPAEWE